MDAKAILKRTMWRAAQMPPLGRALIGYYELKSSASGWTREHPYDRANGVQTSGFIPGRVLRSDGSNAYLGAQPSIVRRALTAIPDPADCHFLDLGCGKGRALLVATEFGFASITGVELSATLSAIARRNAAVFARTHPDRTPIHVVTGDALTHRLPQTNLVIFLYNPFHRPLMSQLLLNIEGSIRATGREIYIVYYNPTWADVLDASYALERRYAAQLAYDPVEIGYGPDQSDAVVIWQNRGNPQPHPPGDPTVAVTVVSPGIRVEINE
ncbi:methyltransferase domain-containing protein [Rhodopila sp.]|uniref:methyltransferase domain-containing protein n=1 Tax=Rhodopila sp. TaxID=2480087 RepID=UPI003D0AEDF0